MRRRTLDLRLRRDELEGALGFLKDDAFQTDERGVLCPFDCKTRGSVTRQGQNSAWHTAQQAAHKLGFDELGVQVDHIDLTLTRTLRCMLGRICREWRRKQLWSCREAIGRRIRRRGWCSWWDGERNAEKLAHIAEPEVVYRQYGVEAVFNSGQQSLGGRDRAQRTGQTRRPSCREMRVSSCR